MFDPTPFMHHDDILFCVYKFSLIQYVVLYNCIYVFILNMSRCHVKMIVQFRPYCQVWRLGPLDLTY